MMYWAICLLVFCVIAGDCRPAFEEICLKDSSSGFDFQIDYKTNVSTIELTLVSNYARNFTYVRLQLFAKWNDDPGESLCQEDRLLLHSVRDVPALQNDIHVRLRYIFSGFYRLTVHPWNDANDNFQSETIHFLIRTAQRPVAVQNWTTQFTIHPIPHSSAIIVQFLPADEEYEFSQYEVLLSSCQEISSASLADHGLVCYANHTKPECQFDGLTAGEYCAFVRPIDSRCNFGYVWQVKDYCIVHSDVIQLQSTGSDLTLISSDSIFIRSSGKSYSATVLGSVLTSFLLIAILLGVMLYRLLARKPTITIKDGQKFSTLDIDNGCESKERLHKTILLLWIQDDDGLANQVAQLKLLLSVHCTANILDIFDDDLYDELSVDPVRWLNKTMSIQGLRIVIIGSSNLELLYSEAQFIGDEIKRLGSLENLVLYAIQLIWLRKTVNHSLYSSTFFVRFSNNWNEYHLGGLTPFRCFLLPAHHSELVYYLNN